MTDRLAIDYRAIADLIPYARNSRTHSDAQVAQIAASISEFGWTNPVIVDGSNGIIAGHGRVLAARKLGIDTVPCIEVAHMSEAQKRAYVIADNKLALNAGWDDELLKVEFSDLMAEGFDISVIGFDELEIDALLGVEESEGLTDEDAVPDAPAQPVTVLGDVWVMGRHRIVCGDATNPDDWAKLAIGDDFVTFSSPPYNAGNASGLRDKYQRGVKKSNKFYDQYSDDLTDTGYENLLRDVVAAAFIHTDTVALNVQPLAGSKRPLLRWMNEYSSHLVDVITWDKGRAAPHIQPGIMSSRYEWIVILSRKENASRVVPHSSWQGKHSNVYMAPPQSVNEFASVHGATFPVHLPSFVVGDLMNRSRGVVDCFLGTGTTIIAAEKLGRDGRGIELSPAYVDVAVKRWQEFTGKQATLEETGKTFAEMSEVPRAEMVTA
jgi:DNA modification methylase